MHPIMQYPRSQGIFKNLLFRKIEVKLLSTHLKSFSLMFFCTTVLSDANRYIYLCLGPQQGFDIIGR